ncbi:MAG TPA: MBL fold metallo-hydrolase [bacterium]|nr:MBL fold metallo-hydrolase [bacterium]HPN31469.1 MBL fold metallo-hydrolase [bacterium]
MQIKIFQVGDIDTNCYIVFDEKESTGVVIDPGAESGIISDFINLKKISVKYVLLTHGHYDHAAEAAALSEICNCPVYIHKDDLKVYKMFAPLIKSISKRELFEDFLFYSENQIFKVSEDIELKAFSTPGHSPGGVCFELSKYKILFTGDTIFYGTYGRTDLRGGNEKDIINSLKKIISGYGGYKIFPGHGRDSTIEFEKENNDFLSLL